MMTRTNGILCGGFAVLLIGGVPFAEDALAQEDAAEPVAEQRVLEVAEKRVPQIGEVARKRVPKIDVNAVESVYRHLLKQYTTGEAGGVQHLELLNTWSLRVNAAQVRALADSVDGLGRLEMYMQALHEHGNRMQAIEELVAKLHQQGRVPQTDLVAARVLSVQAQQLPAQIEELAWMSMSDRELKVELPSASEAAPLTEKPPELIVSIAEDGGLKVDGKDVSHEELDGVLRQYVQKHPGYATVVIYADRNTRVQNAMEVMKACRRAGVQDYMIQTASAE